MLELLQGNTILSLAIGIIGFVWGILMLFAPLFWYGTYKNTQKTSQLAKDMVDQQRQLVELQRSMIERLKVKKPAQKTQQAAEGELAT